MNPAEFTTLVQAEQSHWWFRGMRKILFRVIDPLAARRTVTRVLDAGCGTGHFAGLLAERYGWPVFPLDLSEAGLAHAKAAGTPRLTRADIGCLPFPSASFDVVVSLDVLVHFGPGQEREAIAEFARVLKTRGLLVLRVAALDILRSRHSEFVRERQRFTRGPLSRGVSEHGFRILRCTYANALLAPAALARFRVWEPLLRRPPQTGTARVPPWLDGLLFSALNAESLWIGAGLNFAAGQSLILVAERV